MGTGVSLRNNDEEDAGDYSNEPGVTKRIPVEIKPRGKLGLRASLSSFAKKQKNGSTQSALSDEGLHPGVVQMKKDFDMLKLTKDNELASVVKSLEKTETEYKRLRSELTALQATCKKLREERVMALDAEQQAMVRAAAFEIDRDKIQRRFKIYRETTENEKQTLLKDLREAEARNGYRGDRMISNLDHDREGSSKSSTENMLGAGNPGDWWTTLDSEPSLGSTSQLHASSLRGPELANSMMELDGPFTNVNKEDWNVCSATLAQIQPTIPDTMQPNTVKIYISATEDRYAEVTMFMKEYQHTLDQICHSEGRFCLLIFMPLQSHMSKQQTKYQTDEVKIESCCKRIQQASLFLAFIGARFHRFIDMECQYGHLQNPGYRPAVFCFPSLHLLTDSRISGDLERVQKAVRDSGSAKIIDGYTSVKDGVMKAFNQVSSILKMELGITDQTNKDVVERDLEMEGPEMLCGGCLWDPKHDYEQIESLNAATTSSCQLGFEKYYERLHAHVSSAGPVPPLLVIGDAGAGKSLLLAKWMELLNQKASTSLILSHIAEPSQSCSADPILMIRRLTSQLMQHVSAPPALTSDPQRLMEEFPRWLEKVSAKIPGGIILILDSGDRFLKCEQHLKWLLDPLPVDTRVVLSVQNKTCPSIWKSWPTLKIEELNNKCVKELLKNELSSRGQDLSGTQLDRVVKHCHTSHTRSPLYIVLLASELARSRSSDCIDKSLDTLLTAKDTVHLYKVILDCIKQDHETGSNKGLMKQILCLIYASRNGLNECELFSVVVGLTWTFWAMLCDSLLDRHILTWRSGLLIFTHQQTRQAVFEKYMGDSDPKMLDKSRKILKKYFCQFESPADVTYRVADELPWTTKQLGDKEALKKAILNLCVFVKLYGRGRSGELIYYWQYIGADKNTMAHAYVEALKTMEQMVGQHSGLITLPRIADVYEALGRFLRDLGLLSEAITPLQRALEIRESALDPDHPKVAQTLHQVASLHAQWNKFTTAEALYKQALDIYEGAFGSDHYLVAKELDALAVLYQKQSKHELVDALHRRACNIRKKCTVPRITSGTLRGVDPLRRRMLQLEELAMGPDSADLARTLNELGVLNYLQNNTEGAESFLTRSLEMRESVLGPDHPDVSQSLNNLAALYNDRKQYERAEPLYEKALQIRLQNVSSDHQSVASVSRHLALLYKKMGKIDKAIPLYLQIVGIRERVFGQQHPSVATALVNLAVLYSQQKHHLTALPLYQRALKIYEDSFGPRHPRVAETLRNLALLRYDQGDFEKACKLYKRATEIKDHDSRHGMRMRVDSTTETGSTVKSRGPSPVRD